MFFNTGFKYICRDNQHNDIQQNHTQHNNNKMKHNVVTLTQYNADRCYTECSIFIIMLSEITLSVVMWNDIMLNVVAPF